ncbi:hypothetical protein IJ541_10620 [bacterium]|nr:hypothetical protein [bacterium]
MQNYVGGSFPQELNNAVSSPAVSPQANSLEYKDVFYQLEQAIGADVEHVRNLVQNNVITQNQGQYLLQKLVAKAQQINAYKESVMQNNQTQPVQEPAAAQDPMTLFNQERPGFFDGEARGEILNYIKGFDMDKDEIDKIAKLVEVIENSAVENYLKKTAYEKSLNDENTIAKSKLTAYAQNAPSDNKMDRIFTREEIGNMSGDEFAKNEKMIMAQLKQGLIK